MRLNVAFSELVSDLRAELRLSSQLSHGIGDVTHLKRALNAEYLQLYAEHAWPHLKRVFPQFAVAAGQRYYDPPANLDLERIQKVRVWWNGTPHDLLRGIDTVEYGSYDSVIDERTDPPQRYDIVYPDGQLEAMVEIWPVPASATAKLEFVGTRSVAKLVDDDDLCLLDAEAVVARAAARLAAKEERQQRVIDGNRAVHAARSRQPDGRRICIGLGDANPGPPAGKAIVRVS